MAFNTYPDEPLAPLPEPVNGLITLIIPDAPYMIAADFPPVRAEEPYQYKGETFPISSPYKYICDGTPTIYQAFIASVSATVSFGYWSADPPLNLMLTEEEARSRVWYFYNYLFSDSYSSAGISANGWADSPPSDPSYPRGTGFFKHWFYPILFEDEKRVPIPFKLYYVIGDTRIEYYARLNSTSSYGVSWRQHEYIRPNAGGSIVPLLSALMGPLSTALPFLFPLAFAFPFIPLIGDAGAYGAGGSVNNSAGRRRRKEEKS